MAPITRLSKQQLSHCTWLLSCLVSFWLGAQFHLYQHATTTTTTTTVDKNAPPRRQQVVINPLHQSKNQFQGIVDRDDDDTVDHGWRSIQVFRGRRKTLANMTLQDWKHQGIRKEKELRANSKNKNAFDWHSQVGQDFMVSALFRHEKKHGYFVDLAANAAVYLSNTYALERRLHWTGLCIEANPHYWQDLARMRSCQVVAAAVGQRRMEAISFQLQQEFGGIVGFDNKQKQNKNKKDNNNNHPEVYYTVPLVEILDRFQAPQHVDYLSLDVEGAEDFILSGFEFDRYQFSIVTVERPKPHLVQLLREKGYRFLKKVSDFGELLFAHESVLAQLDLKAIGITIPWTEVDQPRSPQNHPQELESHWELMGTNEPTPPLPREKILGMSEQTLSKKKR